MDLRKSKLDTDGHILTFDPASRPGVQGSKPQIHGIQREIHRKRCMQHAAVQGMPSLLASRGGRRKASCQIWFCEEVCLVHSFHFSDLRVKPTSKERRKWAVREILEKERQDRIWPMWFHVILDCWSSSDTFDSWKDRIEAKKDYRNDVKRKWKVRISLNDRCHSAGRNCGSHQIV